MFPKILNTENPGRPVISSVNCHTIISQYVNHHLQPDLKKLNSYVKDSLKKKNNLGKIHENSVLVTMDVRSLYINISHKQGIKAVETKLKRKNKPTSVVITFLKLILTSNRYNFHCTNYLKNRRMSYGN